MALALVIRRDGRVHAKLIADPSEREMLHFARGMNPRTEHHVLHQRAVAEAKQDTGMAKSLLGIDAVRLADAVEVFAQELLRQLQRSDPKPRAGRERVF